MFSPGRKRLVDGEGIDWWDLTSLLLAQDDLAVLTPRRLCGEIEPSAELWATRRDAPIGLLAVLLSREIRPFGRAGLARAVAGMARYAGLARRFSAAQIKEIGIRLRVPGQRRRMVREVLSPEDSQFVKVVDGPPTKLRCRRPGLGLRLNRPR